MKKTLGLSEFDQHRVKWRGESARVYAGIGVLASLACLIFAGLGVLTMRRHDIVIGLMMFVGAAVQAWLVRSAYRSRGELLDGIARIMAGLEPEPLS